MSDAADEFLHNIKFASAQQTGDYGPFVYGHIASYDPKTHRVRLILPSVRNDDDTPVLTGWMPLGSPGAGAGWGIQIAPAGGATQDNPTGGELCVVQRMDQQQGVQAVASQVWNQVNTPPFGDLAPGEIALKSKAGSFIRLDKDNNVGISAGAELNVSAEGPISIITQGDTSITSNGTTTIVSNGDCTLSSSGSLILAAVTNLVMTAEHITMGAGGAVNRLVTGAFKALFNTHTHGASSAVPNQQMTDDALTTVVEAQ